MPSFASGESRVVEKCAMPTAAMPARITTFTSTMRSSTRLETRTPRRFTPRNAAITAAVSTRAVHGGAPNASAA